MTLNKETVYMEIVSGKRMSEIAGEYKVAVYKIEYYRRQLIKDGLLVFHRGIRPVPKNPDDREAFWLNRIRSWKMPENTEQSKERGRMIRQIKARSEFFNNVTDQRIQR